MVKRWPVRLLVLVLGAVAGSSRAEAQAVPQGQVQQLIQQNPELVRQRIRQSGLTPDQIRARLEAAGYSPSLLDPFLGTAPEAGGAAVVNQEVLRALELLVPSGQAAEAVQPLGVEAGLGARPAQPAEEAGKLQLFGLSVFRGRTTQFQPLLSGPVPPNYKIGPGDVMVLVITGDVEFVYELPVTREGFIVIPQVGQIFVSGLTMAQLNQLLQSRLGRAYSGIRSGTTRFDVTVARLRTNQVFVIGEVVNPGAYQLASVATVLNALYAAGGPTERGNFRAIQVRRRGEIVAQLDLYDYLLNGSTENDIVLEQGDVVFVPLRGPRVSVSGAVVRPAIYELRPDETLEDLLIAAGGFSPEADLRRLAVHRILPQRERGPGPAPRAVLDIALAEAAGSRAAARPGNDPDGLSSLAPGRELLRGTLVPKLALEDGDSVVVDSVTPPGGSLYVSIAGMVRKPGRYPWREGMTLRDLVMLARGPTVGAYLVEAEVARLSGERSNGELAKAVRVPLDSSYLIERDSTGRYVGPPGIAAPPAGTAPEVPLEPYDAVTILRQPEFELHRSVEITGEVKFPGPYVLVRKDERLSDLVRRAGGLLPTAFVAGAQLLRDFNPSPETGTAAADVRRVDIRLDEALRRPGSAADVVLRPGDRLVIPEYVATVRVQGAVNSPANVLYREGEGLDYYIANAGGYARNADKGRVHVRYANGSARVKSRFLFFTSDLKPGPGSVITVPVKPEGEPFNPTQFFASLAQIAASVVAIIVVARSP
ncbi:MAG: hypothetical protein KatS3mg081_0052 [Gemmatimonadales bacterium]|nr:MAG: hypothetical protein KatS3mg081_0052 [Gemmatimonadales bacterium]